jgi:hypothetical protein
MKNLVRLKAKIGLTVGGIVVVVVVVVVVVLVVVVVVGEGNVVAVVVAIVDVASNEELCSTLVGVDCIDYIKKVNISISKKQQQC